MRLCKLAGELSPHVKQLAGSDVNITSNITSNAGNPLISTELQHRFEIKSSANVTKVEKISLIDIWLNPKCYFVYFEKGCSAAYI